MSATLAPITLRTPAATMDAYLGGDDHALGVLYRLLAPRIRRVVQLRIDDADLVEDIVQLTFVKAHHGRHAFRARAADGQHSDDAVIAWYLAIARNTAIDGIRAERRHQHGRVRVADERDAEPLDEVPSTLEDPEALALLAERSDAVQARVRAAVAALPPGQRDVVELHKLRGLPMAAVAERLHVRPGAARVRAHRAYLALARALGPQSATHAAA